MTTLEEKFKRLKLDIEPVIENKVRRLKNDNPNIKPTLKNTILDIHSKPPKSFNPQHTKYFDRHFKNGKPKSFKEDSNMNMLEDTKYKTFARSRPGDPFEKLFGFKHKDRPIGYLDGYYEFNMAGKDNLFYIKDKLLRENGTITDLEARLQAKAEFMDLYKLRQQGYNEINQAFIEQEEQEPAIIEALTTEIEDQDMTSEEKEKAITKIKVNRAVRRKEQKAEAQERMEAGIKQAVEDTKYPKPKTIEDITTAMSNFKSIQPKDLTMTKVRSINEVLKVLESKTQEPVKFITSSMSDANIKKALKHNQKVVVKVEEAERKTEEEKLIRKERTTKSGSEQNRLQGLLKAKHNAAAGGGGKGPPQQFTAPRTPQQPAADDHKEEEEVDPDEVLESDDEEEEEDVEQLWETARSLDELEPAIDRLLPQLERILSSDEEAKLNDKAIKDKLNSVVAFIQVDKTAQPAYKARFKTNSKIARAVETLRAVQNGSLGQLTQYYLRGSSPARGNQGNEDEF